MSSALMIATIPVIGIIIRGEVRAGCPT